MHKLCIILFFSISTGLSGSELCYRDVCSLDSDIENSCRNKTLVIKHILKNGMPILIRPTDLKDRVAIEVWYGVGSKHEKTHEHGHAHLVEHMLFKGTEKLSESDFFLISKKLSGFANAGTSYDYTRIYYHLPIASWQHALPILANVMVNCSFEQDRLNSELKTVVQELKMGRDNYHKKLHYELLAALYPDHPYHYPIIGLKQDIWNTNANDLKAFYKRHYIPNNAVLVVVGKVDQAQVIQLAEQHFGDLPPDRTYKQPQFYRSQEFRSHEVVLYRAVEKPLVKLAWIIPGLSAERVPFTPMLIALLTYGTTGRLVKKLKEQLLVDSLHMYQFDFFDTDVLFISFIPRASNLIDTIINKIKEELADIVNNGATHEELARHSKIFERSYYSALESNSAQAEGIASHYLASHDEDYFFSRRALLMLDTPSLSLFNNQLKYYVATYLRPSLMNVGKIMKLNHEDEEHARSLQIQDDADDERIIAGKVRSSPVDPGKYVTTIQAPTTPNDNYPIPSTHILRNGMKVLAYKTSHTPLVKIQIHFRQQIDTQSNTHPYLKNCLWKMIEAGKTTKRSREEVNEAFENAGIRYTVEPGNISAKCISRDLDLALDLLHETMVELDFDERTLHKVKISLLANYEAYFDNAEAIALDLADKAVYKELYPAHCPDVTTQKCIQELILEDIRMAYYNTISPPGALIIVVGDFGDEEDLFNALEKKFGSWQGPHVELQTCGAVSLIPAHKITYYLDRDQITLIMSVRPFHLNMSEQDLRVLRLYTTNLNYRLFQLRELTGAFYAIEYRQIKSPNKPDLGIVYTIISKDRLSEVIELLMKFFENDSNSFDDEELAMAKSWISHKRDLNYATIDGITGTLARLHDLDLPCDYYHKQPEYYAYITVEDVKKLAKSIFSPQRLGTVIVGRTEDMDKCTETLMPQIKYSRRNNMRKIT